MDRNCSRPAGSEADGLSAPTRLSTAVRLSAASLAVLLTESIAAAHSPSLVADAPIRIERCAIESRSVDPDPFQRVSVAVGDRTVNWILKSPFRCVHGCPHRRALSGNAGHYRRAWYVRPWDAHRTNLQRFQRRDSWERLGRLPRHRRDVQRRHAVASALSPRGLQCPTGGVDPYRLLIDSTSERQVSDLTAIA